MTAKTLLTKQEIDEFEETGELSEKVFDKLYPYYLALGDMPYGVAKARDGDPYQWIADRLSSEL